jgi:hypothetical protein
MKDENTALITTLAEKYDKLLMKNYKYQMGDDDYQLSTYEKKLNDSIQFIINDLRNQNKIKEVK